MAFRFDAFRDRAAAQVLSPDRVPRDEQVRRAGRLDPRPVRALLPLVPDLVADDLHLVDVVDLDLALQRDVRPVVPVRVVADDLVMLLWLPPAPVPLLTSMPLKLLP